MKKDGTMESLSWRCKKINSWTNIYTSLDSHLEIRETELDEKTSFEVCHNNRVIEEFKHFQLAEKYIMQN